MGWLEICEEAGKKASEAIKEIYEKSEAAEIVKRGAGGDKTTKIDLAAEGAAFEVLKNCGKSFVLISEEMGEVRIGDEPSEIVVMDPLDGSTNAKTGIPLFAISIAIVGMDGTMGSARLGYVRHLLNDSCFWAEKGKGAYFNESRMSASKSPELKHLCMAFPPGKKSEESVSAYAKLMKNARHTRALGSVALDICYLAKGSFDAFFVAGCRTLDMAAAKLIAEEAGCIFTDEDGKSLDRLMADLKTRTSILAAGNKKLHSSLLTLLKRK